MRHRNLRTSSQVQKDYDDNISDYEMVRFGTPGGQYVNTKEQEFVARMIRGSSVLEVGTASGRFAVSLTNRGAEYVGVDLSQKMLRTTSERTSHAASIVRMDACQLGFRSHFDHVLCLRTFHFLSKPVEALQGMFTALKPSGMCLVTFEADNSFRRLLLFLGIGTSEQYYYKTSDVEDLFLKAGFQIVGSGCVMRVPVTLYRGCPRSVLWILRLLERLWPWPMHEYLLGVKNEGAATDCRKMLESVIS